MVMCSIEKKMNSQDLDELPCISVSSINNYEKTIIDAMVLLNLSIALDN